MKLNIKVDGEKVVQHNLMNLTDNLEKATQRGLTRSAKGVYREAFKWLSGPGRKKVTRKTRKRGQADSLGARPGGYPVPVITGNLRRLLDWLKPGTSKSTGAGERIEAGSKESIIYNSAAYGHVIRDGTYSSEKFGSRDYMADALEVFDQGGRIEKTIDEEVEKVIRRTGL